MAAFEVSLIGRFSGVPRGLEVIENWNRANDFILYGKGGEFARNKLESPETLMLSLHLESGRFRGVCLVMQSK